MRDWIALQNDIVSNGKLGDAEDAVGPLAPLLFIGLLVLNDQYGERGVIPKKVAGRPNYLRRSLSSFLLNSSGDEITAAIAALDSVGLIEARPDGSVALAGFDQDHWAKCTRCRKPNPSRFNWCPKCREKDRAGRQRNPHESDAGSEKPAQSPHEPGEPGAPMRDPAPVETVEHPENPHELSDSPQTRTDHERDDCGNAGPAQTPPATHPTPPHPTMGGAASASSEDPDLPKPQYAEGEDGQVTPDRSVEKMEMALQMAGVGDAKACASIMVDAGATIDDVAALRASVSRADDPGGVMVKAIREGTWRDRLAAQQARRDEPNADSRIQTDPHAIERMQVDLERRGIERLDLRLHERAAITEIASSPTLTLDRLSGWIDHIQAAHGVENVPDYLQRFLSATPDVWRASFEHVESGASAAVSATSAASPPPSSNGDADAMYGEPVASDGKSEGP